jgi:hypothetical protein
MQHFLRDELGIPVLYAQFLRDELGLPMTIASLSKELV